MDCFGPDNFSLQIKGHVLHRARAHLKGLITCWNTILTKTLPIFLSRLQLWKAIPFAKLPCQN